MITGVPACYERGLFTEFLKDCPLFLKCANPSKPYIIIETPQPDSDGHTRHHPNKKDHRIQFSLASGGGLFLFILCSQAFRQTTQSDSIRIHGTTLVFQSSKIVDFVSIARYNVLKKFVQEVRPMQNRDTRIPRFVVLLLLLSLTFSLLSACGSKDRSMDAWVCAMDVVENRLKSPSTADFCSYPEATIIDLGDNRYKIKGYVDAQNTFGATVRTQFTVTLTLTESGYKDASCTM